MKIWTRFSIIYQGKPILFTWAKDWWTWKDSSKPAQLSKCFLIRKGTVLDLGIYRFFTSNSTMKDFSNSKSSCSSSFGVPNPNFLVPTPLQEERRKESKQAAWFDSILHTAIKNSTPRWRRGSWGHALWKVEHRDTSPTSRLRSQTAPYPNSLESCLSMPQVTLVVCPSRFTTVRGHKFFHLAPSFPAAEFNPILSDLGETAAPRHCPSKTS